MNLNIARGWIAGMRRASLRHSLRRGDEREPLLVRFGGAAWVLPAGFLVIVVLVGQFTGPSIQVGNWLLMVPLLAAGVSSPKVTAAFGLLVLILNRWASASMATTELRTEDFLLGVFAVLLAIFISVVRSRARDYVLHLQSAAETTRQVLLRPIPPWWGGMEVAARYLAADVEARVGGDFYEVLSTPHGTRAILGDVQGKGLPAVSTAGAVVGAFREAGYHEPDLDVVASRMESGMSRHNALKSALGDHEERFATAVVISFATDFGSVEVVNFGHEGPFVIGPHGVRQLPQEQGLPVGMAELTGNPPIVVSRIPFDRQETVLLVTDGVTEARNRADEFFPLRKRLERIHADHPDGTAPSLLLRLVIDALLEHTAGRLTDDAALLALRPLPIELPHHDSTPPHDTASSGQALSRK
ncbi:PP2C family protein-serine/threonine phosphatase [Streptomyces sp. NPDC005507]|uniref:PP2C family protein-serine/threonine phosphatase n=1 Tax=Streptomyces sp. NPDC005507 TaxID=3154885 RepID=UPI0033A090B7